MRMEDRFHWPALRASGARRGNTLLPKLGLGMNPASPAIDKCPAAARTLAADLFCMHAAAVRASVHPRAAATGALVWIAWSWVAVGQYMLSMMALVKSPAAVGDTRFAHTSTPPADSP